MGKLFTIGELAQYLRITRRTVYKLLKAGELPATKIGHQWRFDEEVIDRWLQYGTMEVRKHVIVIDDDPISGLLFEEALVESGHAIITARTVAEGMKYIANIKFDMIFLDLEILRIGGAELLQHIRNIRPETPVTIIMSYTAGDIMDEILQQGYVGIMKKPFSVQDIKAVVCC